MNLYSITPLLKSLFKLLVGITATIALCQCGSLPTQNHQPTLRANDYLAHDGHQFPYQKWSTTSSQKNQRSYVLIGVHGFNGYPGDFNNLATALQRINISTYAPATRGQGLDPLTENRGDIRHASQWIQDLLTFTALIREKHPRAQIIWCGESMGSLIALHAAASTSKSASQKPACDLLILSSPIVGFSGQISTSQKALLNVGSALFPKLRFSATQLSGQEDIQMTHDSAHGAQTQHNPWHVEKQTLRLYKNLGRLIDAMPAKLRELPCPLLVLHGGKDHFSTKAGVEDFLKEAPINSSVTYHYYPNSHHLLFYDKDKKRIISDVTDWIQAHPAP